MDENITTITNVIALKLAMEPSVVKTWVETNNYDMEQLNIIAKQIHYNEIYLPTLVDAIIHNKDYQISTY